MHLKITIDAASSSYTKQANSSNLLPRKHFCSKLWWGIALGITPRLDDACFQKPQIFLFLFLIYDFKTNFVSEFGLVNNKKVISPDHFLPLHILQNTNVITFIFLFLFLTFYFFSLFLFVCL